METILTIVNGFFSALPFRSATWFVLIIIVFLFGIFAFKRNSADVKVIYWEDLIIDPDTGKVTPYKVGYLIGMIVSTWIVISLVDANNLSFDILGLYLSYLLGGAGWSEFVNKRSKQHQPYIERPYTDTERPYIDTERDQSDKR